MDNQQTEGISFPDLMARRDEETREYYDDAHWKLVTDFITMSKRNSGDYMGVMRQNRRNNWLGVLNKGFVTYPVIPRSIRSKTATAVSTDVGLEITSTLQTPEKKAGAELAKNIYLYEEERGWTERVETLIALHGQLGKFAAILTETDENGAITVGSNDLTAPGWMKTGDDIICCLNCASEYTPDQLGLQPLQGGAAENKRTINADSPNYDHPESVAPDLKQAQNFPNVPENVPENVLENVAEKTNEISADYPPKPENDKYDLTNAVCRNPDCGSMNLGVKETAQYRQSEIPTGEIEAIRAAKITNTVISPLLIRFDDVHTVGFDWTKAHWFNYHPLESRYEIINDCPELEDRIGGGDWANWSDASRWHYELSKSEGNTGAPSRRQLGTINELVEVNYWFYQPVKCHGWTEPDGMGWELIKNGESVFSIKPGESIKDACLRSFNTDKFDGLMVKMVGKEIVDVKNVSFLDLFTLVGWVLSATSHVPVGEEKLIQLQDAATRVFSMVYSCVQRLSIPKGWADGRVWNKDDLLDSQVGKWIMSKQDMNPSDLPRGIQGSIGYIAPPNPSNLVEIFIQLIIQIAKEESGIYDETVGNANSMNTTKGGREVALTQSLGLMSPTQKAKKEGKIAWTRVILKLWQQMPDEAFVLIKGTYEEEWKQTDIEAFKGLDIDGEIVIKAIEGTDIPKTRPQQLENFSVAAQMGLLSPNPGIQPELQQYILKNVLGIDFDMDNIEADRRLASRRLEAMHDIVDKYAQQVGGYDKLIQIVPDPVSGIDKRVIQESVLFSIAQDVRTKPRQEDNHAAFAGYYTDQIKGVTGAREPREIDVMILENALDMHNQLIAEKAKNEQLAGMMAQQGANAMNPPPPVAGENQPRV